MANWVSTCPVMRVCHQKPPAVLVGGVFELGGMGGFLAAFPHLPLIIKRLKSKFQVKEKEALQMGGWFTAATVPRFQTLAPD
ncbi:hypothetical protein T01_10018 [Trichinella spiralis]|uniref:Uncharacterized protein n=1 Tax=Trichinella spiralis TaxID=6334 RepID=A0A0V1BWR9_TRISP|nr:hypothetical protein T01_10018 [Trichinella spiralis]